MAVHPYTSRSILIAALLVPLAGSASSDSPSRSRAERAPVLRVFLSPGFLVDSFQRGPAAELHPGESDLSEVVLASDVRGPCSSTLQMAVGGAAPYHGEASASWLVRASLVSTEGDRATVDLRWQRTVHRPGALLESDMTLEQRLTLRDGGKGIIDVVRAAPGVETACSSVALGVELGFRSLVDEVQDSGVAYDVWLIDKGDAPRVRPAHTTASARHDQGAPFEFPPVQLNPSVTVGVSGTIKGRVRKDGAIDLHVDTWQGYLHPGGSVGGGGRTTVLVTPGETVEFALPQQLGARLPPEVPQHAFALQVTTTRLW